MLHMKRFFLATGATFAALLVLAPAPAFAAIIELGTTTTPLAQPVCPATGGCPIILTETTAPAARARRRPIRSLPAPRRPS